MDTGKIVAVKTIISKIQRILKIHFLHFSREILPNASALGIVAEILFATDSSILSIGSPQKDWRKEPGAQPMPILKINFFNLL